MNISDIARWRNCEAEALHGTRQPGRLGAARYVGILAHAYMLGEPSGPVGQRVAWDATTQDAMIAQVQARAIANAGLQCMIDAGWEILETEQSVKTEQDRGRYDIHAYSNELRATAIIDLKTGSSVGSAWLQVGGYLHTFEPESDQPAYGGVLLVSRVRIDRPTEAALDVRMARPLIDAWENWNARIFEVVTKCEQPTRSPGRHCARCALDCPVRSEDRREER